MKHFSPSRQQFLALYRAGVWQTPIDEAPFATAVNWQEVIDIAQEQTTLGIVIDSLQHLKGDYGQREVIMKHLGIVLQIEQANQRMNAFLPKLFAMLAQHGIDAWLLKGQGVARYYANPLLRQSGDIDVFIPNPQQFEQANRLCRQSFKVLNKEEHSVEETIYQYKDIVIELHSKINATINPSIRQKSEQWVHNELHKPAIVWAIDNAKVMLPPVSFDALYIFIHLARHYFGSCIGLRQITDWLRFLAYHHETIDQEQLISHIHQLGLTRIWQVFAAMAVDYLGCPPHVMPLYRATHHQKAAQLLQYILDSGNFGRHDKHIKTTSSNLFIQKAVAMMGHLRMKMRNVSIFPVEAVYRLSDFFQDGFQRFFNSLKH